MASDLAERLEAAEEPGNRGGVPECLVTTARETVKLGFGSVDDTNAISQDLANEVYPKANRMTIWYKKVGDPILNYPGNGQIGFLRGEELPLSPGGRTRHFCVHPVTAKHNLRHYIDEHGAEYTAKSSQVVLRDITDITADINFGGDLDWVPNEELDAFHIRDESAMTARPAIWKYGIDVSEAPVIANIVKGITDELNSFLPVRSSFRLEKGQKVGIAIIFTDKTRPTPKSVAGCGEDEKKHITSDELKKIYGEPNKVNIYTGKITHVGEKHIEYDVNLFTSCSGAIVFLLDQDQPESVQPQDYGKAVAIHAGAHPFVNDRNLGFKLRGNVPSVGPELID